MSAREAVLAYSGGTDSTCVASLLAEAGVKVHLLTFVESATRDSPVPTGNVERLRAAFGRESFTHEVLPIDRLLRHFSTYSYWDRVRRHGFFMLATPGFSSLSWHVRTIVYCLENGLRESTDGLTRELMHFPGHMDGVREEFRRLYARFGIEYTSPVREWPVPPDRRLTDRLIVDRHDFLPYDEERLQRTTGRYLFDKGILPRPDVKGSSFDRGMQHDCYPFVVFNIFAFWLYLGFHDLASYERRMVALFREAAQEAGELIAEHQRLGARSRLAGLLAP